MTSVIERLCALLGEALTREERAKRIAEALRQSGSYRWVGIYDVDLARGWVSNLAWSGPGAPAHPVFPVTQGLTSRAIAERRTINVGDVANDPDYLTAFSSTRSEIIVPVLDRSGRVVGTVDVESELPNAFDGAAQSFLEECVRALEGLWAGS